ncbi:MAG TPA: arylsulfotransferase family protein [Longimicrobiales bacterium]|nr:arylsulfotransferase family protein [Longimicrobiales bacterium]
MTQRSRSDRIALVLFVLATAGGVFMYGVAVGHFQWFPFSVLEQLHDATRMAVTGESDSWYVRQVDHGFEGPVRRGDGARAGLNLVTRFESETEFRAEILDMDGALVHQWAVDWFDVWPDADHLPEQRIPRERPGTHIHGAVVLPDGDLVYNYEHLGLVRLDRDGEVVWRLPYPTHHSVHLDEAGNLWVSGQIDHESPVDRFPQRSPPFSEYTALEVSPDGEILSEWSVSRILEENDLGGLLHLGTTANRDLGVGGADILHLNDVEPFPDSLAEGVFRRGDVMVSLRNINTVLVFDRESREIRHIATGRFVRQHDPDFLDGNRYSVYDNNNIAPEARGSRSRIVILDARDGSVTTWFEGGPDVPFYSDIMGKHQWLPDGHLLVTESMQGRAVEIDASREVVWEYVNQVRPGTVGIVEEVQRLPAGFEAIYR